MIKVEHLSKHFGKVKAVDGISFEVNAHENLILLGTSGCGKTTTLKMLNRLIEPTSGSIQINDKDVLNQSREELRRGNFFTFTSWLMEFFVSSMNSCAACF